MRRIIGGVALGVLALFAGAAHAITNGEPDNGAHPYVGLVAFYDADDVYRQRCSGALIAKKVVLTVAHCAFADDGTRLTTARVWFDDVIAPGVISGCSGAPSGQDGCGTKGTAVPHPGFDDYASFPDTKDVAVVLLDSKVKGVGLGKLPPVGILDELKRKKKDSLFTLVGYGFVQIKPDVIEGDRTRRTTTARLGGLNGKSTAGFNLKTKPGQDGGTFCSGDSGGPVLLGDTKVVVAISSLGKGNRCEKADLNYRIDTQATQDWIASVVGSAARLGDESDG